MKLIDCIESQAARLTQAGLFFGHGTTNAFDEAMWLALWRLGLPLDELDEHEERELTGEEVAAITTLITAGADAGKVRSDVAPADVLASLSGVSLAAGEPDQRAQAGRLLDLIMDGLRYRPIA